MTFLQVSVQKQYASFNLDIRFDCDPHITALFGPSGGGKTSILRMIAGLTKPDRGTISIDNQTMYDHKAGIDVPVNRRRIGFVFQHSNLFPHLSVAANLKFSHWAGGRQTKLDFDKVVEVLGISALLDRRPGALSGGERQRIAIGRALLSDPQVLLMDEPFSAVDLQRKTEIQKFLLMIHKQFALPIIVVSHAREDVDRLANRVIFVEKGRVNSKQQVSGQGSTTQSLKQGSTRARLLAVAQDGQTFTVEIEGTVVKLPGKMLPDNVNPGDTVSINLHKAEQSNAPK